MFNITCEYISMYERVRLIIVNLRTPPGCAPVRLHDDGGMWYDPSGSYFLALDPAYTYNPESVGTEYLFHAFEHEDKDVNSDLFCFHAEEGVWKYYGIFVCLGSQTITLQQAKEELLIPEKVRIIQERRCITWTKDVIGRRLIL